MVDLTQSDDRSNFLELDGDTSDSEPRFGEFSEEGRMREMVRLEQVLNRGQ
jgi:hypothetical protein